MNRHPVTKNDRSMLLAAFPSDPYRRTGRTTRGVEASIARAAAGGGCVVYVSANQHLSEQAVRIARELEPGAIFDHRTGSLQLQDGGTVSFESVYGATSRFFGCRGFYRFDHYQPDTEAAHSLNMALRCSGLRPLDE